MTDTLQDKCFWCFATMEEETPCTCRSCENGACRRCCIYWPEIRQELEHWHPFEMPAQHPEEQE